MTDVMKKIIPDRPFVLEMPPVETGGCSILMVGSGRSGKTTMLKYLMDTYFQRHCGAIFSQSAKAEAYKNMKYPLMPLSSVYIPELVNCAYRINRETKNTYPFLFVLDDVPLAKNDKELMKTTTVYRNSGISLIHGVQTPTLVSPTCRSNYTFFLLFHNNSSEQAENVCKQFLRGYFPNTGWPMNRRVQWLQETTKDHHFLFVDNWANTIQRCKLDLS
jgi:hypothetical protein